MRASLAVLALLSACGSSDAATPPTPSPAPTSAPSSAPTSAAPVASAPPTEAAAPVAPAAAAPIALMLENLPKTSRAEIAAVFGDSDGPPPLVLEDDRARTLTPERAQETRVVAVRPIVTGEPGEHRVVLFRHYPGKVYLAEARAEGRLREATYACRAPNEDEREVSDEEDVEGQDEDESELFDQVAQRCESGYVALEVYQGRDLAQGLEGKFYRWMIAKVSREGSEGPFRETARVELLPYASEGELPEEAQLRVANLDGDPVEEATAVFTTGDPMIPRTSVRASFIVDGRRLARQAALIRFVEGDPSFRSSIAGAYSIDDATHALVYRVVHAATACSAGLSVSSVPACATFLETSTSCPYDVATDAFVCGGRPVEPLDRVGGGYLGEDWAAFLPSIALPNERGDAEAEAEGEAEAEAEAESGAEAEAEGPEAEGEAEADGEAEGVLRGTLVGEEPGTAAVDVRGVRPN